jgi:hypothetical protein
MPQESILTSTKKILGIDADYTEFDLDVITHINTAFMSLRQLGVGPADGFVIEDDTKVWGDFSPNMVMLAAVKSYLYFKVRLLFDPPATSFAIESMERTLSELEWRLNVVAETITPPSDPTASSTTSCT